MLAEIFARMFADRRWANFYEPTVAGAGEDHVFDYMRCNQYTLGGDTVAPRCEYVFPAKRLNIAPDQLEVVLLDNGDDRGARELGNRAYGVYLAFLNARAPFCAPAPTSPTASCGQPGQPGAGWFGRCFQSYTEGVVTNERTNSAAGCDACQIGEFFTKGIGGFFGDFFNIFGL